MKKAIIVLAILVSIAWLVAASSDSRKAAADNIDITLFADEYFFSFTQGGAPNPTLIFTEGDVVNATVHNVGGTTHGWQIVASLANPTTVLFGAQISSILPGSQSSVVFTVTQTGTFNYICPVSNHASFFGMHGQVTVNVIPEYPTVAVLAIFMASVLVLTAVYKRKRFSLKSTIAGS